MNFIDFVMTTDSEVAGCRSPRRQPAVALLRLLLRRRLATDVLNVKNVRSHIEKRCCHRIPTSCESVGCGTSAIENGFSTRPGAVRLSEIAVRHR